MKAISPRQQLILNYLCNEGYATVKTIQREMFKDRFSVATIRQDLKKLEILVNYKNLPSKTIGERVYYLTETGLKTVGVKKLKSYQKRLARIRLPHIRHYLQTRVIERKFQKFFEGTEYQVEACNEFSDTQNILHVHLKNHGRTINFRSDALVKILKNGNERLILRVETDMGTQNFNTLLYKFKNYEIYFKTLKKEVFLLFVCQRNRIVRIIDRLKLEYLKFSLFLAIEDLADGSQSNAFKGIITDGKKTSLQELLDERELILNFIETVQQAAKRYPNHQFFINSRYHQDPFFPICLGDKLWQPDGYLRIKGRYQTQDLKELKELKELELLERLFAVVMTIRKPEDLTQLKNYENFLQNHRLKVTKVNNIALLVIINQDIDQVTKFFKQYTKIPKNIRILLAQNCTARKIFSHKVWVCLDGGIISLEKDQKKN